MAAVPLTYLASQAGWVVAEVGRQPWAIQNLMPVRVGVTDVPPTSVGVTFGLFASRSSRCCWPPNYASCSDRSNGAPTGPKSD